METQERIYTNGFNNRTREEVLVQVVTVRKKLENLRTQYEAQVEALRHELERERRTQVRQGDGATHVDVIDDVTGHDTDKALAEAEAALKETLLAQLRSDLEVTHQGAIDNLSASLAKTTGERDKFFADIKSLERRMEEQQDVIQQQREQISRQNALIDEQRKQFEEELKMQLQAQSTTLKAVFSSKSALLQEEMEHENTEQLDTLKSQIDDLRRELESKNDLENIQQQSENANLEKLQQELEDSYQREYANLRHELEQVKSESLDKLRSDLELEHQKALNELEEHLGSEALQAQNLIVNKVEAQRDESFRNQLNEIEMKHSKALQDLEEQLSIQHAEETDKINNSNDEALISQNDLHSKIVADFQRVLAEREDEINMVKRELDDEKSNLAKEKESIVEETKVELRGSKNNVMKLQQELEEERCNTNNLNETIQNLQNDIAGHLAKISDLEQDLVEERKAISEIESEKDSLINETEAQKKQSIEELRKTLETEKLSALQHLEEQLNSDHEKVLKTLTANHQAALEDLKEMYTANMEAAVHELRKQLETEHSEALVELRDNIYTEKEEELQKVTSDLEVDKLKALEELRSELSKNKNEEIDALQLELEKEKAMVADQLRGQVADLPEGKYDINERDTTDGSSQTDIDPSTVQLQNNRESSSLKDEIANTKKYYENELKRREKVFNDQIKALEDQIPDDQHKLLTPRSNSSQSGLESGVLGESQRSFRETLAPADSDFMYFESDDDSDNVGGDGLYTTNAIESQGPGYPQTPSNAEHSNSDLLISFDDDEPREHVEQGDFFRAASRMGFDEMVEIIDTESENSNEDIQIPKSPHGSLPPDKSYPQPVNDGLKGVVERETSEENDGDEKEELAELHRDTRNGSFSDDLTEDTSQETQDQQESSRSNEAQNDDFIDGSDAEDIMSETTSSHLEIENGKEQQGESEEGNESSDYESIASDTNHVVTYKYESSYNKEDPNDQSKIVVPGINQTNNHNVPGRSTNQKDCLIDDKECDEDEETGIIPLSEADDEDEDHEYSSSNDQIGRVSEPKEPDAFDLLADQQLFPEDKSNPQGKNPIDQPEENSPRHVVQGIYPDSIGDKSDGGIVIDDENNEDKKPGKVYKPELPVLVIQHTDEDDLSIVHEFYPSLDALDGTDMGSDKKWIAHLQGRLESYESEKESLKEKIELMQDEHVEEKEEMNEKLKEFEEEMMRLLHENMALKEASDTSEEAGIQLTKAETEIDSYREGMKDMQERLSNLEESNNSDSGLNYIAKLNEYENELAEMKNAYQTSIQLQKDQELHVNALQAEINQLKMKSNDCIQNLEEAESRYKSEVNQNKELKSVMQTQSANLIGLEENLMEKERDINQMKKDLYILHQENDELKEKLKLCEQEVDELKIEATELEQANKKKTQEQEKLTQEQSFTIRELRQISKNKDSENNEIAIEYEQKIKDYEDEINQLKNQLRKDEVLALHEEIEKLKRDHARELDKIRIDVEKKYMKELDSLHQDLKQRYEDDAKDLTERYMLEIEHLKSRLVLQTTDVNQFSTRNPVQESWSSNLDVEPVSPKQYSEPESNDPALIQAYKEKIKYLESNIDEEVQQRNRELIAHHEDELDRVRTVLRDYQEQFNRLKSELSESYAYELNNVLQKHADEMANMKHTFAEINTKEIIDLQQRLAEKHHENMLDLTAALTVEQAQDLAIKRLKQEVQSSSQYDVLSHQNLSAFSYNQLPPPPSDYFKHLDKDTLEAEYQSEMQRVKAELEEMYNQSQKELRTELQKQHESEINQMRENLNLEHQHEREQINNDLIAAHEELKIAQSNKELLYQSEIHDLRAECDEKAAEIIRLQHVIEDQLEDSSKIAASHTEEFENLKNDERRNFDSDMEKVRMSYEEMLHQNKGILHGLENECKRLTEENENLMNAEETAVENLNKAELEKKNLEEELDRMKLEIEEFKEDRSIIQGFQKQEEKIEEERKRLEYEWKVLQDEKEEVESSKGNVQKDEEKLQKELNDIIGDKHSAMEEMNFVRYEKEKLKNEFEALNSEKENFAKENATWQEDVLKLQEAKNQYKKDIDELEIMKQNSIKEKTETESEKQLWAEEKVEIAEFRVEMLSEQERLREQLDHLFAEIDSKTKELDNLKKQISELKGKESLSEHQQEDMSLDSLIPVKEEAIVPEVAKLCGDDSDEEETHKDHTYTVTGDEDVDENEDDITDSFDSFTPESYTSSGESLKAELEAAEAKEKSLEEDPVERPLASTGQFVPMASVDTDVVTDEDLVIDSDVSGADCNTRPNSQELEAIKVELRKAENKLKELQREIEKHEHSLKELKQLCLAEQAKAVSGSAASEEAMDAGATTLLVQKVDSAVMKETPELMTFSPPRVNGQHDATLEEDLAKLHQDERDTVRRHEQLLEHLKREHIEQLEKVKDGIEVSS